MTPDTIFVVTSTNRGARALGPAAFRDAADAAAFYVRLVAIGDAPGGPSLASQVKVTAKTLTNHGGVSRNGISAESVPLG